MENGGVILLQVVVSGLLMGAVYALFSSGLTLIWGMMNVVNFAHGDFVMLAMYAAFFGFTLLHVGPLFFVPGAAALLFVLGVVVYLGLVRHVAKGPMLAQILGTFGLAVVLRYAAFWAFTANFVSLPDNLVGGTLVFGGLRIEASRLLAGVLALVITLGMHFVLTRTATADVCGFDYVLLTGADAAPGLPPERFRLLSRSGFAALYGITRCRAPADRPGSSG